MKKRGLLLDAFVGLLLTAFAAYGYLTQSGPLAGVEFKAYDLRAKLRQTMVPPAEIVLVTIDDDSIAQLGRWPWPRTRIAAALDRIAAAGPKVIGLNVLFSEPEQNLGLIELKRLQERYAELVKARKIAQRGVDFEQEFSSSTVALDSDSKFLASLQSAGKVIMPLFFAPNTTRAAPAAAPEEVAGSGVQLALPEDAVPLQEKMIAPVPAFAAASAGLGHANLFTELDGVFRRDAPAVSYGGRVYPSYALRLAMAYHGLKPADIKLEPGVRLKAGPLDIPLDDESMMPVTFIGPPGAETIKSASFQNVITGGVSPDFFKDRIVLIGQTALGVGSNYVTPVAGDVPGVEVVAHALENILHGRFITRPIWAEKLEWGLIAAMGLFVMLVLPRMRAFWGLVISLLFAVAIAGAGTYFFMTAGHWIKVGYPLSLLLAGYLVVISKSFLVTEKGKELVEASAIETNKMLGLSFQGQGMLDLAFEKFRLCPLDDNMKDTLYNLALDFERKRQYSKAAAVFDHIAAKDPKYKDIAEKTKMLKAAADGAVFGGVGASKKEGTVMITGGATKPTLGRYEIEKELGRGAMGVVYLGKDPKINRMVAIKTMMLEEGSNAAETKEVKERFFREAESAGTLNHPNIVRIFDAGEENEVAYIAMELLDGQDLTKNCAKDALLPTEKAVEYVAMVADALDYAHGAGIVHRDIKPANIMLLKDGTIRVADFGIARITASSKTATGTVMGTPSYMSPEQVAGKKVDGRSDLFSLAVALFELLTGEKPFKGGEGIGTLLFQIANDPHPDPTTVKPGLPPALKSVIDKGLAKDPAQRFQRGSEMAAALRAALKGGAAPAPAAAAPSPAASPAPAASAHTAPATAPAIAPPPPSSPVPAGSRTTELMEGMAAAASAAPAPKPAPAAPPAPAADKTAAVEVIPGINDAPAPAPAAKPAPAPSPAPAATPAPKPAATPASEKTVRIGPEITIPGLNDLKPVAPKPAAAAPVPAPAPAAPPPPAPSPDATLKFELPQRGGVGAPVDAPAPERAGDAGGTMRIEPTQAPGGTIKLKPRDPQEPA